MEKNEKSIEKMQLKLGSNIKTLREKNNLTQVQLSCKVGIANTRICDIEHGRGGLPKISTIKKLSKALNVKEKTLLKGC